MSYRIDDDNFHRIYRNDQRLNNKMNARNKLYRISFVLTRLVPRCDIARSLRDRKEEGTEKRRRKGEGTREKRKRIGETATKSILAVPDICLGCDQGGFGFYVSMVAE